MADQDQLPAAISNLLAEFQVVFSTPTSLPPSRDCDHTIPLIPGTRPVNVRPYHYPPALKDEIECQVIEMLQVSFNRAHLLFSLLFCWLGKKMPPGDFVSTIDILTLSL